MPDLSIKVIKPEGVVPSVAVIKLTGFLDTNTSSEFEHAIKKLLFDGIFRIVVDLEDVDYISSAGWGIFVSEIKNIREKQGDLKLVRMIPDVFEIFRLLEFDDIFEICDSVEEAIEKFK
ncbi:MAG TPA: anti-sigma factor antagonist [Firmicutes bacterium]|nr:anti-sigma factor antagonist [Bacillota bacterium]